MADRSHTEPDATLPLEEQAFLERYDPAGFGHPSVAVDVVLLSAFDRALHALLLERDQLPERGKWAIPGGFVSLLESLGDAAVRILEAKTGLEDVYLEQLYTFGGLDRDPRTRVISGAYLALMNRERFEAAALDNPSLAIARLDVPWQGETGGPLSVLDTRGREMQVAFDHLDILGMTVKRLRGKLGYVPIGFQLLSRLFTLRELQQVHEAVLGETLNKDSFRRKVLASGMVEATGQYETTASHRPAEYYRFAKAVNL